MSLRLARVARVILIGIMTLVVDTAASQDLGSVGGMVFVTFTSAGLPPASQTSLQNATFGVSEIDAVLQAHQASPMIKLMPTYGTYSDPASSRLERTFLIYYADGDDPAEVAAELAALGIVESAVTNQRHWKYYGGAKQYIPPDGAFNDQWNLHSPPPNDDRDIDGPEAWAIEKGNASIIIGVIDSGTMVDVSAGGIGGVEQYRLHSDLRHFFNDPEDNENKLLLDKLDLDGGDANDADEESLVDNTIGYRFNAVPGAITNPLARKFWQSVPSNWDWSFELRDVERYNLHGVHVASVAAATVGTGTSIAGVANGCSVYMIRDGVQSLDSTITDIWSEMQALRLATDMCQVINVSWWLTPEPVQQFHDLISNAVNIRDRVIVAIAGNRSEPLSDPGLDVLWPGRYDEVLCVGNMEQDLSVDQDSRYGPLLGYVDVVAPVDEGIPADGHTSQCGVHPCFLEENVEGAFGGTSAAAPQVAGVAALVRSRFPTLNQLEVRERIKRSCQKYWLDTPENEIQLGKGKVNAYRALTEWGKIETNTTWSANLTRDGKYYISGDLTIEPGVTLTINPGVVVKVAPDHDRTAPDLDRIQIIVKGSLIINGTFLSPVTFESFVDPVQGSSDWLGIKFETGSTGNLSNLIIKNATRAIENYAAIAVSNCSVSNSDAAIRSHANITGSNISISNTSGSSPAIEVLGGIGSFTACSFTGTPRAIENSVPITLTDCNFTSCGAVLVSSASVTAGGTSFIGNTGNPAVRVNSGSSEFTACLFLGNTNAIENFSPITLSNCTLKSGGVAVTARANLTTTGSVFANNSAVLTAVDVYAGTASFTNCTLTSNTGSAIAVRGTSTPILNKCVTAMNGGPAVRAMSGWSGTPTMQNSIVFGNGTDGVSWTDAQWQTNGQNVFNENPAFCNGGAGDYRLYAFSPAAAGPHYSERAGAFDIGCAPPAAVTATTPHVRACPAGDFETLVITIDFDNAVMTRDVGASEIRLDIQDIAAKVFEEDGVLSATGPATASNGWYTTITHAAFGYFCEDDAGDILLNGYPLTVQANINVRTPDCASAFGTINLHDAALFGSHYTSPPKAYNEACDFDNSGAIVLPDFVTFAAHHNHFSESGPANAPTDLVPSNAHIELQFTEEFPTATSHRLYVDVGAEDFAGVSASAFCFDPRNERLDFVEWVPTQTTLGDVLFAPVVRDGASQLFFLALVSESFVGTDSPLGRLVFDVDGMETIEIGPGEFVQTVSDVLMQGADTTVVAGSMAGTVHREFNPTAARIYHNRLEQNYPNPFNPTTTIAYSLKSANHVRLTIYDVAGRQVRELVNERQERGAYKAVWDGRNDHGATVSSGVYFYKLVAGSFTDTKKMTMLK